jgi:hypothetical protein
MPNAVSSAICTVTNTVGVVDAASNEIGIAFGGMKSTLAHT